MLIPVLKCELDKTGKIITVNDITGGDNLASSTKYSTGGINPNRTKNNTVTEVVITLPNGNVFTFFKNNAFNSVDISILATDSANVMPKTVLFNSFTNTELATNLVLPTGIAKIEYYVWYFLACLEDAQGIKLSTTTIDVTGINSYDLEATLYDTDLIKLVSADSLLSMANAKTFTNKVTNLDTYISTKIMQLDKPISNTDLPVNTRVIVLAGYKTTEYLKLDVELLECFQPKIAKLAIQEKSCCATCKSTNVDALEDILTGLFVVDAQIEAGLWDNADKNLKALLKICKSNGCNNC